MGWQELHDTAQNGYIAFREVKHGSDGNNGINYFIGLDRSLDPKALYTCKAGMQVVAARRLMAHQIPLPLMPQEASDIVTALATVCNQFNYLCSLHQQHGALGLSNFRFKPDFIQLLKGGAAYLADHDVDQSMLTCMLVEQSQPIRPAFSDDDRAYALGLVDPLQPLPERMASRQSWAAPDPRPAG